MHKNSNMTIFSSVIILLTIIISLNSVEITDNQSIIEENELIFETDQLNKNQNIIKENIINPISAGIVTFDSPSFNIDLTQPYEYINDNFWREGGNNETPNGVDVRIHQNILKFYGGTDDNGGNYSYLEMKVNLANYSISNLQVNYSVLYNFTKSDVSSYFRWQYSRNNNTYQSIDTPDAYQLSQANSSILNFDKRSFNLSTLIDSSTWNFTLRFYVNFENQNQMQNSTVWINSITMTQYSSTFQFNNQLNDLDENVIVNYTVVSNFSYSGLSTNTANYRLYYQFGTSIFTDDNFTTATGSFTSSRATLQFTIPEDAYQVNGTLFFQITIIDRTIKMNSTIQSISVADRIAPEFSSTILLNDTNPASLQFNYTDSLLLSVNVTDNGGMNLSWAQVFWLSGGILPVSKTNSDGNKTYNFTVGTILTELNIEIPTTAFYATIPTNLIIYLCDGSSNEISSSIVSVTALDKTKPRIFLDSPPATMTIQYDEWIYVNYRFQEDLHGSGFSSQTASDCRLYWKLGDLPDNETDASGIAAQENPQNTKEFTSTSLCFNTKLNNMGYAIGQQLYIWVNIKDKSGNLNSTYLNPLNFTITENYAPRINFEGTTDENFGYDGDKGINITFVEDPLESKVNPSTIRIYYRLNNDTFELSNVVNITQMTTGPTTAINLITAINKTVYNFNDNITIFVYANDTLNNQAYQKFTINAIDIYKPNVEILSSYPYTNLTQARTKYNLKITVNSEDFLGGSGINRVELRIANNITSLAISPANATASGNSNSIYELFISKINITAGLRYYSIRSYDESGNYNELIGNFTIVDQKDDPNFVYKEFVSLKSNRINKPSFNFSFQVNYDCLMSIYLNGTVQNPIPYQGDRFTHLFSNLTEGYYQLVIDYYNESIPFDFYIDLTNPQAISKESIQISKDGSIILIQWGIPAGSEDETLIYTIYLGSTPDFDVNDPYVSKYIGESTDLTSFQFEMVEPAGTYYFKIVPKDLAGNIGPASEPIEYKHVSSINQFIIYGGIGLGVGVVALVVVRKIKSRSIGKTLEERGFDGATSNKVKSKNDLIWESMDEDKVKPKQEDKIWEDLSSDAWSSKTSSGTSSSSVPANASLGTRSPVTIAPKTGINTSDPLSRFDAQMQDVYREAQEFVDLGQESMAAKSYEMLLRLAEKKGDAQMIDFVKKKLEGLY